MTTDFRVDSGGKNTTAVDEGPANRSAPKTEAFAHSQETRQPQELTLNQMRQLASA